MNDPYCLTDAPARGGAGPSPTVGDDGPSPAVPPADRDRLTGLLWVALAICVGLNAMFSVISPDNLLPSLAFGVAALGCVGLLVARRLRRRQP
ncbi:hypothetical protein NF556_17860 [Ornithinimicrobium faecis]|uniref:Uncharacterized protein n=1 Tax=Ornithinimicrobium faecis TaxID=2934158 RepID=A0ABY4YS78_9MICO|nr:hypothetical protein [Ornithinimicrobium sp. HY1793]USQ79446.1 hypothetical protein NF556_17860 [Ornithinimicrobium sp. HY1793]